MPYILRLFNGQTPERNNERLRLLEQVTQEIELFPDQYQVASGLEEGFQGEVERPPLLAFVHYGEWTDIGQSFQSWNPKTRKNSYHFLFSGGGISDTDADGIRKAAASVDEFEEHVYVLQKPFPPDTELLKQFVDEFTSFFSQKRTSGGETPPTPPPGEPESESSEPIEQETRARSGRSGGKAEASTSTSQDVTRRDERDRADLHEALQDIMDRLNREMAAKILPALSILCQGYLAVHSDVDAAQSALDHMGWSDDLMPDRLDLGAKRDEVTDPQNEWWQVFNGDLKKQAKEEWERDPMGGWRKVSDLIECISSVEDPGTETVAEAYCKLVERLGGEPCQ